MKKIITLLLAILVLLPSTLTMSYAYSLPFSDVTCSVSGGKVTLSWTSASNRQCSIYYKRSNSDEWILAGTTLKKKVNISGLKNGMRYDFKIEINGVESETVSVLLHNDDEIMLDVAEYCQYPDYPTGCECASLYMLLKYYDVDVTMEEIVNALPKGPKPFTMYGQLYGGNPEREFVGNPRDANSFGVYNEPIRTTAKEFRSGAMTKTGATIEDIAEIISSGNPVIAWFTSNLEKVIDYRYEWLDCRNPEDTVVWLTYEHAVLVYGINDSEVYYNDPKTGYCCSLDIETFETIFNTFGGRIVYYEE